MNSPTTNEAIVIGAGIVGLCCGLSLLEKGVPVRLIDRDEPGQGASRGNAGVISPWSCVPQSLPGTWKSIPRWLLDPEGPVAIRPRYLLKAVPYALRFLKAGRIDRVRQISAAMSALTRPNIDLYRHHLSGTGQEGLLRESSYVLVSRKPEDASLDDLASQLRIAQGARLERLDDGPLHELEPDLSPDYKAAILVRDQARALSPGDIGAALATKARALGATFLRTGVRGLVPREGGGWRLITDGGELDAPQVVVAAGAWSARLLEPLGIRVPLEPERGYHLLFRDPGVRLNNSVLEVERKFVASSMAMGLRSAGTAELAGLDAAPDYRRARVFERLTKRLLPGLNTADSEEWMGIRPSMPDSLPCLGAVPGQAGLFAAFGHGHYGLGMAPMTGRLIAELVAGATPNLDLAPYAVDRFDG